MSIWQHLSCQDLAGSDRWGAGLGIVVSQREPHVDFKLELMSAFYRRLWKDRKPKAKVLWESKLELRSRRNARGEPVYALRDWAAWVLVGDPE